jgi:hypothetical protein
MKMGDASLMHWMSVIEGRDFEKFDFEEQRMIWDTKSTVTGEPITITWDLDAEDAGYRTHFFPIEPLRLGLSKAHGTRRYREKDEDRVIPMFVARSETLKTPFLSFHEPFGETPVFKRIEQRETANGRAFFIELPAGAQHCWTVQLPHALKPSACEGLSARAEIGFASIGEGTLETLAFFNGTSAEFGEFAIESADGNPLSHAVLSREADGSWNLRASGLVEVRTPRGVRFTVIR